MRFLTGLTIAALAAGCTGGGFAGDFGATPGGVQDMSLARDLIAEGKVPPAEAFLVEGMFSEHELGLEGEPCATLLCARAAAGLAPTLEGVDAGWLQVGLSSTIDPETFVRPSQTIIATVDVSGSMGWDYGDETPATIAVGLLEALADQLDERDRLAIVTYGSDVSTLLTLTAGSDRERIQQAIDSLGEGGSTNMEAGMRRAYDIAGGAVNETDETRVILFTDAQPNVGAVSASEFQQIAAAGAGQGVGLTVLGLGLGLNAELLGAMSTLRGGNAFSLTAAADVEPFMDDNWPWMVSPIAYDMSLTAESSASVGEAYGFPGDEGETALEVATVFLSKRKGALLVRLDDEAIAAGFTANVGLSYTEVDGTERSLALEAGFDGASELDSRGHFYDQAAVAKTTALAILVDAMRRAAKFYGPDRGLAVELMTTAAARIAADAEALGDPALTPEVELADALLTLMENDAPQGDFYGGF